MSYTIPDAIGIRESDSGKALLVEAPEFEKGKWIPHSQITDDSEVYKVGTTGDLVVTDWLAEQEGWI